MIYGKNKGKPTQTVNVEFGEMPVQHSTVQVDVAPIKMEPPEINLTVNTPAQTEDHTHHHTHVHKNPPFMGLYTFSKAALILVGTGIGALITYDVAKNGEDSALAKLLHGKPVEQTIVNVKAGPDLSKDLYKMQMTLDSMKANQKEVVEKDTTDLMEMPTHPDFMRPEDNADTTGVDSTATGVRSFKM